MRSNLPPVLILIVFVLAMAGAPGVHAHNVTIPVIVDTDAALDDMRAIALLLQDGHFDIRAVVTSDGACSPGAGAAGIARALEFMERGDIPVGKGRSLGVPAPPWREISELFEGLRLPSRAEKGIFPGAVETITGVIKTAGDVTEYRKNGEGKKVTYICLGPLTNLADALRSNPSLAERIAAVYYYGMMEDSKGFETSWNTARDSESAAAVAASGIPVFSCFLPDGKLLVFDRSLYNEVISFDGRGPELIRLLHSGDKAARLLDEGHFRAWDETVVLCMMEPFLTDFSRVGAAAQTSGHIQELTSFDIDGARSIYIETFRYGASPAQRRKTVVFDRFPADPDVVRSDIRPIMAELIQRHGFEEWRATVLTNELHRHLGIYSILGVKMGLYAREILDATLDDLRVVSRADLKPPLSCMNDGLQVSTGASLGRGTISIDTGTSPDPEALFILGEDSITLRLKPVVIEKIKGDVQAAIDEHGNLTPEYFAEIRRLALRYWLEMDRREIFEIIDDRPSR